MRERAKNDVVLYSMVFQKCIGPDMFSWNRHYVAEVCAPPSTLLVIISVTISLRVYGNPEKVPLVSYNYVIFCYKQCLVLASWFGWLAWDPGGS